jgi:DNA (cytosine-5)-methyltransferase 1
MNFGSLFSGIGGIDLGLVRAGMTPIWQCEIDPFCRGVLASNFPGVPCYDDVRTLNFSRVSRPDVLAAGFPCQPASVAGHFNGQSHGSWLWDYVREACRLLRPSIALLENVPGLLTVSDGTAFGSVLSDLAENGFDADWTVLPTGLISGSPHYRRRVFVLAYPSGLRCQAGEILNRAVDEARSQKLAASPWTGRIVRSDGGRIFRVPDFEFCQMADAFPEELDSLMAYGNAVVPDFVELIGRAVMEVFR